MSVYLGQFGYVELRRKSRASVLSSVVNSSDINVSRRRFSFDFDASFLTSGDRIEIRSTDGSLLLFVSASGWNTNTQQSSGSWYVNVDDLGGIRLYTTLDAALAGDVSGAIPLEAIVSSIPIDVTIDNDIPKILAQCSYFELNTNREAVDITALGDEFRSQYSSLISGSGNFRAYWEYLPTYANGKIGESAHYLLQLAIRTEVGSEFSAKFYLKAPGYTIDSSTAANDEIWYEFDGIITQAGVNFSPENAVEITADFVTTGSIRLLTLTAPVSKVLQENLGDIRLEQDSTGSILQESID